ncbi:MAG: hypothetical protein ACK420_00980, partial [Sphingomonadales bacterium]
MNKKLKWGLIITLSVLVLGGIGRALTKGDQEEKVVVENAIKRTIVETVNASGKIYPEIEVK